MRNPNFGVWPDAAEESRRLAGKQAVSVMVDDGDSVNVDDVQMLLADGMSVGEISDILGCGVFAVLAAIESVRQIHV